MKAPHSRADGVSNYRNNVYHIAASCVELDPIKLSLLVRVGLWLIKPTRLTLYLISLDISIWNNTDNVKPNSCQVKLSGCQAHRMNTPNPETSTNRGLHRTLGVIFAILVIITGRALTDAKEPLFDAFKPVIVLDPGHGGNDAGARSSDGTSEKTIALKLAQLIADELTKDVKVVLTRTDDYGVDLSKRTALANQLNADLFISLHCGGSFVHSTSGTLIFYYQNFGEKHENNIENQFTTDMDRQTAVLWDEVQNAHVHNSRRLAEAIMARISKLEAIKKCRIQGAPLAVLKGANMPAILLEVGYLTNPSDEKALRDVKFLIDLAQKISKGVENFLTNEPQ